MIEMRHHQIDRKQLRDSVASKLTPVSLVFLRLLLHDVARFQTPIAVGIGEIIFRCTELQYSAVESSAVKSSAV